MRSVLLWSLRNYCLFSCWACQPNGFYMIVASYDHYLLVAFCIFLILVIMMCCCSIFARLNIVFLLSLLACWSLCGYCFLSFSDLAVFRSLSNYCFLWFFQISIWNMYYCSACAWWFLLGYYIQYSIISFIGLLVIDLSLLVFWLEIIINTTM